jgi:hypothetical protein
MRNSARIKWSHATNFVVADIAHNSMILSTAWEEKENPNIHWDTGVRHRRTLTDAEDGTTHLISISTFVATMRTELMLGYKLYLHK